MPLACVINKSLFYNYFKLLFYSKICLSIENVKHGSEIEEPSPPVLQPHSEYAPSTSAQPVFWNDEATKLLIAEMRAREEKK